MTRTTCDRCGEEYGIGDWPMCKSKANPDGHTRPLEHRPFIPYIDYHISRDGKPVEITSWGELRRQMRINRVDFPDEGIARRHHERVERLRDERRA